MTDPTEAKADNVRRLRAAERFALFLPTRMRLGFDFVTVHVLDLSTSGALITCTVPLAVGTRVRLQLGERTREARVVRRDARQFGVEFAVALSRDEVAALVGGGAAAQRAAAAR